MKIKVNVSFPELLHVYHEISNEVISGKIKMVSCAKNNFCAVSYFSGSSESISVVYSIVEKQIIEITITDKNKTISFYSE